MQTGKSLETSINGQVNPNDEKWVPADPSPIDPIPLEPSYPSLESFLNKATTLSFEEKALLGYAFLDAVAKKNATYAIEYISHFNVLDKNFPLKWIEKEDWHQKKIQAASELLIPALVEKEIEVFKKLYEFLHINHHDIPNEEINFWIDFLSTMDSKKKEKCIEFLQEKGVYRLCSITSELMQKFFKNNVKRGFLEPVYQLLAHDTSILIDAVDDDDNTPLHLAIQSNNIAIVRLLLEKGAEINRGNFLGRTPLHISVVFHCNIEIIRLLLEKGADTEAIDQDERTSLHLAVSNDAAIEVLLKHNANPNAADWKGHSVLHRAKDLKTIKLLLEYGANINAVDETGSTALHHAALHGPVDKVSLLLKLEADPKKVNNYQYTPLHFANDAKVARLLLEHNALVDAVVDDNGMTPLHCAALNCRNEVIQVLLEYGADANAVNFPGKTALHYVVAHGKLETVLLLLMYGADPNKADKNGETPLSIAKKEDRIEIIGFLSAKGEVSSSPSLSSFTQFWKGDLSAKSNTTDDKQSKENPDGNYIPPP